MDVKQMCRFTWGWWQHITAWMTSSTMGKSRIIIPLYTFSCRSKWLWSTQMHGPWLFLSVMLTETVQHQIHTLQVYSIINHVGHTMLSMNYSGWKLEPGVLIVSKDFTIPALLHTTKQRAPPPSWGGQAPLAWPVHLHPICGKGNHCSESLW